MTATHAQRLWMYEQMILSRYLEDQLIAIYLEGKQPVFDWAAGPLPGELHLSYGQEAVSAGLVACLDNSKDWMHAGHRPHHMAVAYGVNLNELMAELLGKKTGLCKGKGGHMHIYDKRVNFAASSIIGEQMPAAVGMAMACKMNKTGGIAVSVTGDGAANQGAAHEALNFAAVQKLPYLAVIEDNNWAISVNKSESTAWPDNPNRGAPYKLPGEYVSGNDPDAIYEACKKAVDYVRSGQGPYVLEIETYRFMGHFFPDPALYIPKAEKEAWQDSVIDYRAKLLAEGVASEDAFEAQELEVRQRVEDAVKFGRESDYPPLSDAITDVFANA